MNPKSIIFILAILAFSPVIAQQELGLNFMNTLWQSQKTNPSFIPENPRLIIGLPGTYSNLSLPAGFNELIVKISDDEKYIDGDRLLELAEDENIIMTHRDYETLSLGLPLGEYFFTFSHAAREYKYWNYTKETLELAWLGNGAFIGQEVPLEADMAITYYNEFAFGLARKFDKLSLGVRAKLLTGSGDITTRKNKLSLYTDDDIYQLTLNTDYLLNSAGRLEIDSLRRIKFTIAPYRVDDFFRNNLGLGIDIGLRYELNEKLTLNASVLDIGGITWRETNNFSSQGPIDYDGLIFNSLLELDSLDFSNALDTIEEIFAFDEDQESYNTSLPLKFYLGGQYQFNERWRFGALVYGEFFREQFFPAIALNAQFKALDWLDLGASYAWRDDRAFNIGMNGVATFGTFQVYGTTDVIWSVFAPLDSPRGNYRLGFNLLF